MARDLDSPRPSGAEAERRLVERAIHGEPGAFAQLYQAHVGPVFNYVRFRVRDEALAEDLTQDVFVSAYKGIEGLKDTGKFGHWTLRIAHNRVLNHWRSVSARPRETELTPVPGSDGSVLDVDHGACEIAAIELRLAADEILAATPRLTDLQQQVIALRFVAGMSVAETAGVMGRSASAVKNLQHHALAALRRHVAAERVGP